MTLKPQLKVQKINNQTHDLTYGSEGAACFDMVSNEKVMWSPVYTISENTLICYEAIISTGYKFEIPIGFRMDIYPRSGWGFKHNIQLANGTGKIDSDYRGEVKVKLIAFSDIHQLPRIEKGTRIAQAELNAVSLVNFKYVDDLTETERGEGGFGSTGTDSGA